MEWVQVVLYDKPVRRLLSIGLILLHGLAPLALLLPASAESRLPACCRRHGAHHCAMMGQMMQAASSATSLRAPSRCSEFPTGSAAATAPIDALSPTVTAVMPILAQPQSPADAEANARLSQIRTRSGRAPPRNYLG